MARKTNATFAILTPIGRVVSEQAEPVVPALQQGRFLKVATLNVALPSTRADQPGRSVARAIGKGRFDRGDLAIRIDTGEVYAWIKRSRDNIGRLGVLADLIDQVLGSSAVPIPLYLSSGHPDEAARIIQPHLPISYDEIGERINNDVPIMLDRALGTSLLIAAVHASGLKQCANQKNVIAPNDLLRISAIPGQSGCS